MNKEELIALLRVCNADPSAIDVAELAYELGYKAGQLAGPPPQPKEEETND
jgi:LEA14-like dessication related protein